MVDFHHGVFNANAFEKPGSRPGAGNPNVNGTQFGGGPAFQQPGFRLGQNIYNRIRAASAGNQKLRPIHPRSTRDIQNAPPLMQFGAHAVSTVDRLRRMRGQGGWEFMVDDLARSYNVRPDPDENPDYVTWQTRTQRG